MILGTNQASSTDTIPAAAGIGGFSTAILKGLSEVFLADSAITGFIFIAALAADSRRSAALALFGSAIGIVAATIAGASPAAIGNGLYGFSPALTAIAVGSRFDRLGIAPAAYTLLACGATVIIQILIEIAGIPPLTAPFCIAVGAEITKTRIKRAGARSITRPRSFYSGMESIYNQGADLSIFGKCGAAAES